MADLTILSLCSGIGGLELGIRRAVGGRVVGYVEREAYAAAVLLARMESEDLETAPIWCGDLADLDTSAFRGVDILTAGFPCQPFSTASRGRNVAVDLWPAVYRVIDRVRPRGVFLENVQRHPIDAACSDLGLLGYRAARDRFCASELGCPAPRVRWFALAHLDGEGELRCSIDAEVAGVPPVRRLARWEVRPDRFLGVDDGPTSRMDRLRCLGNAVVPAQAELAFGVLARRLFRVRED